MNDVRKRSRRANSRGSMKILERWPVAEIQKRPQINSPEARLVWQLASIQRQMHTLKGSAAKYLIVTEDEDEKLTFDYAPEDEKAVREIAQKRARLFDKYQKISTAISKLDAIAEKAGVEPDITVMNRKLKQLSTEITNVNDTGVSVDYKKAAYEKYKALINSYTAILDEAATY